MDERKKNERSVDNFYGPKREILHTHVKEGFKIQIFLDMLRREESTCGFEKKI